MDPRLVISLNFLQDASDPERGSLGREAAPARALAEADAWRGARLRRAGLADRIIGSWLPP